MRGRLREMIAPWLAEDVGHGDLTTEACVPPQTVAVGSLLAQQDGVIAGLEAAAAVFELVDPRIVWHTPLEDGWKVSAGEALATVSGPARGILTGERLALNLLQRLSGVASLTARFVAAVGSYPVAVLDTRKTTPGLRWLEKRAVRAGGGRNHRFALYDGVLIKDNHIVAAGGVAQAVQAARRAVPHSVQIEVEVETTQQIDDALAAGAEALLLDNMSPDELRAAVQRVARRAWCEASGGITLDTIAAVAATGVDAISIGALTHSAPAMDISLDLRLGNP